MKKALICATNINSRLIHNNVWDSFRAEGRIPINLGYGLSLLGYEVNITSGCWDLK